MELYYFAALLKLKQQTTRAGFSGSVPLVFGCSNTGLKRPGQSGRALAGEVVILDAGGRLQLHAENAYRA